MDAYMATVRAKGRTFLIRCATPDLVLYDVAFPKDTATGRAVHFPIFFCCMTPAGFQARTGWAVGRAPSEDAPNEPL